MKFGPETTLGPDQGFKFSPRKALGPHLFLQLRRKDESSKYKELVSGVRSLCPRLREP